MMRSSVDRPGVKPLCCGRCLANIVLFIRARHMWAKTLTGTDRSIPQYLVQSDFEPFPFQSGRIMAQFQSVGMTLYFQISVKRGGSQPDGDSCIIARKGNNRELATYQWN